MGRLKRIWWYLRAELKALAFLLLANAPLKFGVWLRERLMGCFLKEFGKGTKIQSGIYITNPEKVSIGSNCGFARRVFITGGGGVTIGDWAGFGPDVKVWSVNHRYRDPDVPFQLQDYDQNPVVIGEDVWLGANAFVMPGVTIGKGAVISAYTVVARSVSPYAIVAGNPGRVVGWRKHPEEQAQSRPAPAERA